MPSRAVSRPESNLGQDAVAVLLTPRRQLSHAGQARPRWLPDYAARPGTLWTDTTRKTPWGVPPSRPFPSQTTRHNPLRSAASTRLPIVSPSHPLCATTLPLSSFRPSLNPCSSSAYDTAPKVNPLTRCLCTTIPNSINGAIKIIAPALISSQFVPVAGFSMYAATPT